MELLIAFLIAFGFYSEGDKALNTLTEQGAKEIIVKNDLEKDFYVWGQEADDF